MPEASGAQPAAASLSSSGRLVRRAACAAGWPRRTGRGPAGVVGGAPWALASHGLRHLFCARVGAEGL
jgi:hypothetical protein